MELARPIIKKGEMTSLEGEKMVQGYITIYHRENIGGGGIGKGNHPNNLDGPGD